jgi:hypothetical protein
MKLVKSQLVLEDFFIVNSNYKFIEPTQEEINLKDLMKEYDIDIDFIVRDINKEENKYIIFLKVTINQNENHLPGYSMFAEGVSFYSIENSNELTEKDISDLLWVSGVSMCINNIRNFIGAQSAYYPLGKYTLPSVDLTSLLNTKRNLLNEKK